MRPALARTRNENDKGEERAMTATIHKRSA
jgi:hypothetical protein